MDNDGYKKHLIPMGEYGGKQELEVPDVLNDSIDEAMFHLDIDMVTLTVNGSVMSFSAEYEKTLKYVFTCPLLIEVNRWIHEVEEEKLIRNETLNRLREQKLLFAVSQDSISEGLLSQITLQTLPPSPDSASYTNLGISPSTIRILQESNGYDLPLSTVCDTVAAELNISHEDVEDSLADDLPVLVSERLVSVHFALGKEEAAPTEEEKANLEKIGREYEEKEKQLLEQYDAEAEAAYKAEIAAQEGNE